MLSSLRLIREDDKLVCGPDMWSFGVLVFEITAGYPPFSGADREEQYRAIVEANLGAVTVPDSMDPCCADLVSRLLAKVRRAVVHLHPSFTPASPQLDPSLTPG